MDDYVIPSPLQSAPHESSETKTFGNMSLKMGQIIRINYPDPSQDQSIQVTTYDVFVNEGAGHGARSNIYYNIMMSNVFGGLADYCDYTARANVETDENQVQFLLTGGALTKDDYKKILGCNVIIACMDGNSQNGVILGALPHYLNTIANKY